MTRAFLRVSLVLGCGGLAACASIWGFEDFRDVDTSTPPPSNADAGGDGSPTDAASPFVCPDAALFCDDFENGLLDWQRFSGVGGLIETAPAPAAPGFALHASTPSNSVSSRGYVSRRHAAISSGSFVVRFYVDFSQPIQDGSLLVSIRDRTMGVNELTLGYELGNAETGDTLFITTTNPSGSTPVYGTSALPRHAWSCVEWTAAVGSQGGHTLSVDGVVLIRVDSDTLGTSAGFDETNIGVVRAGNRPDSPQQELYYDHLVVSTAPVGCP